jgi:hypothetical protein
MRTTFLLIPTDKHTNKQIKTKTPFGFFSIFIEVKIGAISGSTYPEKPSQLVCEDATHT